MALVGVTALRVKQVLKKSRRTMRRRKQGANEATIMMRDASRRWAKQRSIVALLGSADDAEARPPPSKVIVQGVNRMGKMVTRVKPKGKAVSFAIIDDDDSDS
eukprot:jgi/Phyca11/503068/fgenesh2_kg.PHYCAscaffold_2_\